MCTSDNKPSWAIHHKLNVEFCSLYHKNMLHPSMHSNIIVKHSFVLTLANSNGSSSFFSVFAYIYVHLCVCMFACTYIADGQRCMYTIITTKPPNQLVTSHILSTDYVPFVNYWCTVPCAAKMLKNSEQLFTGFQQSTAESTYDS